MWEYCCAPATCALPEGNVDGHTQTNSMFRPNVCCLWTTCLPFASNLMSESAAQTAGKSSHKCHTEWCQNLFLSMWTQKRWSREGSCVLAPHWYIPLAGRRRWHHWAEGSPCGLQVGSGAEALVSATHGCCCWGIDSLKSPGSPAVGDRSICSYPFWSQEESVSWADVYHNLLDSSCIKPASAPWATTTYKICRNTHRSSCYSASKTRPISALLYNKFHKSVQHVGFIAWSPWSWIYPWSPLARDSNTGEEIVSEVFMFATVLSSREDWSWCSFHVWTFSIPAPWFHVSCSGTHTRTHTRIHTHTHSDWTAKKASNYRHYKDKNTIPSSVTMAAVDDAREGVSYS